MTLCSAVNGTTAKAQGTPPQLCGEDVRAVGWGICEMMSLRHGMTTVHTNSQQVWLPAQDQASWN